MSAPLARPFSAPSFDALSDEERAEYDAWADGLKSAACEVYDAEAMADANDDGDPRHGRLPSEDSREQWFSPHIVASAAVVPPCAADFSDTSESIPEWALNVEGRA